MLAETALASPNVRQAQSTAVDHPPLKPTVVAALATKVVSVAAGNGDKGQASAPTPQRRVLGAGNSG